jgi:hypothetical protein
MRSHVAALLAGLSGVLAVGCLLVWASPSRAWELDDGPWVYYPLGNRPGVGVGISAWITAAAWFIAAGITVGLLSSSRVSRSWFVMVLLGVPLFVGGTLFGFLESFLWEPQWPTVPFQDYYMAHYGTVLPVGLVVALGGAVMGLVLTRAILGRFRAKALGRLQIA